MPKVLARVASKTNQQRCTVQLLCTCQGVGGLRQASANWQGARMQRSTRKYTRKKNQVLILVIVVMLLPSTRADEDTIVPALIVWVNVLSIPVASPIFASSTVTETGAVRLLVSNSTRLRSTWPHGRLASAKCAESGQCIVGELDGSPGLFDSCQHNLPAFHQRHGHRFRSQP